MKKKVKEKIQKQYDKKTELKIRGLMKAFLIKAKNHGFQDKGYLSPTQFSQVVADAARKTIEQIKRLQENDNA